MGHRDTDAFGAHGGTGGARRHESDRGVEGVRRESASGKQVDGAGANRGPSGAEAASRADGGPAKGT